MARYFIRLKLTLIRSGLRGSVRRQIQLVLGLIAWTGATAVSLALLLTSRTQGTVLPFIFDAYFFGWLLLPLLGLGSDETLDPSRLALLPLTRRQLMGGLLAASLVGIAPVATLLALAGALKQGPALVTVPAVVLELLACIVGSRAMTTSLSGLLRSRRGKDMIVFVIAIIGVLPVFAGQALTRLTVRAGATGTRTATLGTSAHRLFWLPSGWAARAILQARAGHPATALANLAALAAVIVALAALWAYMLQRSLTTAESGPTTKRQRHLDLFAGVLRILPRSRVGAIAAKELRYAWRDPRRRAALVTIMLLLALPAFAVVGHGSHSPRLVLVAAAGALVFGTQALNQFGSDGAAFWTNVASGRDPAIDLKGKNLAAALLGLSVVTLGSLVLATLVTGWAYVPATILLGLCAAGVSLGVANQVSVLAPFPLPDAVTNLWAGPGCLTALTGIASFFVTLALLAPVAIATLAASPVSHPAFYPTCVLAAAYGAIVWRLGLALAAKRLRSHELECLRIVSGEAGA